MSDDPRIVDRTERNAATSFRDNAEGPAVEAQAVTGRANDNPIGEPGEAPLGGNSTFTSRGKANAKAVKSDDAEDKSVRSAKAKATKK